MHLEKIEVDFFSDFPNTKESLNKIWIVVPSWAPAYICGRTEKAQRKDAACENFSNGGGVYDSGLTQRELWVSWSQKYPSSHLWNDNLM